MTEQQLQAIRDREKNASVGKWGVVLRKHVTTVDNAGEPMPRGQQPAGSYYPSIGQTYRDDDAEFIAHARQDIPALLAYVEWLEGIIADAQRDATELFRGERQRGREEMAAALVAHSAVVGPGTIRVAERHIPPIPAEPETIKALRSETGALLGSLIECLEYFESNTYHMNEVIRVGVARLKKIVYPHAK